MKKLLALLLFFGTLPALAQLPNTLTPADKVYGLSKFWQEVNYNFVYLDRIDRARWDEAYRQLITTVQQTPNDYAYYRELQRFCALLHDGHTNVFPPPMKGSAVMTTNFGSYRLFIENIDHKAIIVRTNRSRKDEIPVGSEIVAVNGQPTAEYIGQHVAPYLSTSTAHVQEDWGTSRLLQGLAGDRYEVRIRKPGGRVVTLSLVHAPTTEQEVYPALEPEKGLLDFKWYPNQVAYVSLNSFEKPKIDSLFVALLPELARARGLIVDLRYNTGGSTAIGAEILQYLTRDRLIYGAKSSTRQHVAAYKAWGGFTTQADTVNDRDRGKYLLAFQDRSFHHFPYAPDTLRRATPPIVVPTALLIGHATASAAEDFLLYADNQPHMVRFGENTFGSTGQPYYFDLPGGGEARVCTKKDTYPDGREFVGHGIRPDVVVPRTLPDYLQHRDPVIAKALSYLKAKIH